MPMNSSWNGVAATLELNHAELAIVARTTAAAIVHVTEAHLTSGDRDETLAILSGIFAKLVPDTEACGAILAIVEREIMDIQDQEATKQGAPSRQEKSDE